MRRLQRLALVLLGTLILTAGLGAAFTGQARADSPFRKVSTCDAGFVWLHHTACPSTFWCSFTPTESLFLEWEGERVTIGTRLTSRPASPALKRALFRALESIQDDPTRRAVDISGRYTVEARCRGFDAIASATGTDPNLEDYLRSASLRDVPMFLRWEFTGTAWHARRLMRRLEAELQ